MSSFFVSASAIAEPIPTPALLISTSRRPKRSRCGADDGLDALLVGHVRGHGLGVDALVGEPLDRFLELVGAARRDASAVAVLAERARDREPDPARSARDECRAPLPFAGGTLAEADLQRAVTGSTLVRLVPCSRDSTWRRCAGRGVASPSPPAACGDDGRRRRRARRRPPPSAVRVPVAEGQDDDADAPRPRARARCSRRRSRSSCRASSATASPSSRPRASRSRGSRWRSTSQESGKTNVAGPFPARDLSLDVAPPYQSETVARTPTPRKSLYVANVTFREAGHLRRHGRREARRPARGHRPDRRPRAREGPGAGRG